jgi:class 3 adenylate cyclase
LFALPVEHADSVRRAEGIPLQIRVGLNSGEVVVRSG